MFNVLTIKLQCFFTESKIWPDTHFPQSKGYAASNQLQALHIVFRKYLLLVSDALLVKPEVKLAWSTPDADDIHLVRFVIFWKQAASNNYRWVHQLCVSDHDGESSKKHHFWKRPQWYIKRHNLVYLSVTAKHRNTPNLWKTGIDPVTAELFDLKGKRNFTYLVHPIKVECMNYVMYQQKHLKVKRKESQVRQPNTNSCSKC